ncbi:hypothetical protein, partial [Escherichia coli]
KNIGLDFSRCGLNKEIIIEPEREVLNQLIKMKTISAQNKIENIQDEIISVLNQSSYKKHYY